MSSNVIRETQLADEFSVGLHDTDGLLRQARKASQKRLHEKAGVILAALARGTPKEPDLALHAAQSYEKGDAFEDAARWFLKASEAYAQQNYPTKAVATLRLYRKMAPDEHEGPKRVFNLCRDMDDFKDRLFEFLSPKEQAGHHLRSQDIFAAFDDETFDDMLGSMQLHPLNANDVLVRKGDAATSLFIVIEGRLDGYLTLNGERNCIGSIQPGEICGEIGYFLSGRRAAEVVAGMASNVLELSYSKLDELSERFPAFRERLDRLYHERMLANQLAVNDFFCDMSASLRNEVVRHMQPMFLGGGETLFEGSESTQDAYVVQSGEVAVHISLGGEQNLKTVSSGCLIGEFSVLRGGQRTATARAVGDCRLMKLPGDEYQALFAKHEELRRLLQDRKQEHMEETREFIMNMDPDISDHICTAMLRKIWGADIAGL